MKRSLRILTLCLAIVAAAVVVAGCSNPFATPSVQEARANRTKTEPAVDTPDIGESGTLRVGIITNLGAPLVYQTRGSYEGFDVDVAHAIGEALGLNVTYVPLDSAADATTDTVDCIMGLTATTAGTWTVVSQYMEQANAFFSSPTNAPTTSAKNSGKALITADELKGKTIGIQSGSQSEQLLDKSNLEVERTLFRTLDDVFGALETDDVDYALCTAYAGGFLASEIDDDITMMGTINVPEAVGVGVAADNATLQSAIQKTVDTISSNGVLDILRSKWVGKMPKLSADSQIQGIELSSTATTTDNDDVEGDPGAQDGSSAGTGAVTLDDGNFETDTE